MGRMSPHPRTRQTLARHGQLPRPHPVRQLLALLGIGLATVLVAGAGVVAFAVNDLYSALTEDAVQIGDDAVPPGITELDDRGVSILLLGLDICERDYAAIMGDRCRDKEYGDDGRELVANSDVVMLLHISPEPRRVTVLSFPRDLMVDLPVCETESGEEDGGYFGQLNSAYAIGGLACSAAAVEELTGLPVDHAASITWGGVIGLTSAIGGVTVCVETPIHDPEAGAYFEAGEHTIDGVRALEFLRTRHGLEGGSDLARIGNQQVYMAALVRKLMSEETLSDWGRLFALARTAVRAIEPSTGLTDPVYLARVALAVRNVPLSDFRFVRFPVYDWPQDPDRVVADEVNAATLIQSIRDNAEFAPQPGSGSVPTEGAEPTEGATPPPSATPTAQPDNVYGQTADETRCSAGNG